MSVGAGEAPEAAPGAAAARRRPWQMLDLWAERPPSRLITATVAIVAISTLFRAVLAGTFELRSDEAYYWLWSKETVPSFLDHPPVIAWFVRIGTLLFGDSEFGIRFMTLPAQLATELLLADLVRRTTGDLRAACFTALAIEAMPFFGATGVFVAPDVPLVLFLAGILWSLGRLEQSRDPRWWLAAGVFGGLALLSKYTAVFVIPAILGYLVVPPRNRLWLATPWPYVSALIALALFAPVLAWNADHDWYSFRFQLVRAIVDKPFDPALLGDYLGVALGLAGPVMMPVVTVGTFMAAGLAFRRRDGIALALALAFLVPFLYLAVRGLELRVQPSWQAMIWPFAAAAAAINLAWLEGRVPGRFLRSARPWSSAALVTGFFAVALVHAHLGFGKKPSFGKLDPFGQDAGHGALAEAVAKAAEDEGLTWIAVTDYRLLATFRWHLGDRIPVFQIDERSRYLGFRKPDISGFAHKPGLLIHQTGFPPNQVLDRRGPTTAFLRRIGRSWRGTTFQTFDLNRLTGLVPEVDPPRDSPAYRWQVIAAAQPPVLTASR